jgi:uncharacterized DUF497 family protein
VHQQITAKAKLILLDVATNCSYNTGKRHCMKFEWDENKNDSNIRRHGIDFNDAKGIFDGYTLTIEDERFHYGEQRFISFGIMAGHIIVVVHTETEEKIRIISARKATRNEQEEYFKQITY